MFDAVRILTRNQFNKQYKNRLYFIINVINLPFFISELRILLVDKELANFELFVINNNLGDNENENVTMWFFSLTPYEQQAIEKIAIANFELN